MADRVSACEDLYSNAENLWYICSSVWAQLLVVVHDARAMGIDRCSSMSPVVNIKKNAFQLTSKIARSKSWNSKILLPLMTTTIVHTHNYCTIGFAVCFSFQASELKRVASARVATFQG
jgi:hypothetical protein